VLDIIIAQLGTFGGPVLIALFVSSIVATATTFLKLWQFIRLGVGNYKATRKAMVFWNAGDRASALHVVSSDRAQLSMVVATAMNSLAYNPDDVGQARHLATQAALAALTQMSRHLRILEAVTQAAPMLGLLGTVIGMIEAFGKVAQGGGAADPTALAGGIWIALTTTAAGLSVAIPFYFLSVWFESRVDAERAAMDAAIADVTFGR
jgi:biopolymer transport protein ExbB